MNVIVRADASVQIGAGHVMRMLALATGLRERGARTRFVCRAQPGHLGEKIQRAGFDLTFLPAAPGLVGGGLESTYAAWLGVDGPTDAVQCQAIVNAERPDWVIVDHYALDACWEGRLLQSVPRLMAVDDLANRAHAADVILDQNLGRKSEDYDDLLSARCRRLIGPRYALLRPEFASRREDSLARRCNHPALRRILVSMGGVDIHNMSGRVLGALAAMPLPGNVSVEVILGGGAPHVADVRRMLPNLPFAAELRVDVEDMAERIVGADLVIGAAGSSSWERCCLGVPTLALALADNQREALTALACVGAVTVLDAESLEANLAAALQPAGLAQRLARMSAAAAAITDGAGVGRVVAALEECR